MTELQGGPGSGWALRGERKEGDAPEGTQDLGAFDAVVLSDAMAGSSGALLASLCTLAPSHAAQAVKIWCLVLMRTPLSCGKLVSYQRAHVEVSSRTTTQRQQGIACERACSYSRPLLCDSWRS